MVKTLLKDTTYEPLATLCDNNQLLVVNGNVLCGSSLVKY